MLSITSKRDRREAVIRSSLIDHLQESVQSLIQGPGGQGIPRLSSNVPKGPVLGHSDNTNSLCSVLEAIFIHGLKDSLGEKISSIFLGDLDRMPIPNFWPVVTLITHRNLMEQVSSLSYIVNDVGKGRAWMRLALNQGQLTSYLSVLASEASVLKEYYKPSAFLRDLENCDIMLRVLQPISGISFKLATNAAILNTWTQTPLILSGIWVPPNYEQAGTGPILSATDVASTFYDSSCEEVGVAIPQTPISDQMFDLIVGGTPETEFINDGKCDGKFENQNELHKICEVSRNRDPLKSSPKIENYSEDHINSPNSSGVSRSTLEFKKTKLDNFVTDEVLNENMLKDKGDSICSLIAPSLEQNAEEEEACSVLLSPISVSSEFMSRSISCDESFNEYKSIFSEWEESDNAESLPPFLKLYSSENNQHHSQKQETTPDEETSEFEIVSSTVPLEEEISKYLPLLTQLQKEEGLDQQNYQCRGINCGVPIGLIHGRPRLCSFDCKYYCYECHQEETCLIPARIIHNWDFTRYSVCKANKILLDSFYMQPFINIRLLNPEIYKYVDAMAELQSLRRQLHFIQAYLFTCQTSQKGQELRKLLWPREHLYEHVHLYSVYDLEQVDNRKLARIMKQAVCMGRSHILKCLTCSPRGFICEVCKKNHVLYPFQLDDTFTCGKCNGVFHKHCLRQQTDCPKCKRIELRQATAAAAEAEMEES